MNRRPGRVGLALGVLLLAACSAKSPVDLPAIPPVVPGADRVVLVIIDGLRYSEGLGDPAGRAVPRMRALAARGVRVEPFLNDGPTVTRRAVPAIWCGSWAEPLPLEDPACGGFMNQAAAVPSLFEYYRRGLDRPREDCVYVVGEVGCPWRASFDPDYGPDYWPHTVLEGASDRERWETARRILTGEHPRLLVLYLPDVDHAGHSGEWDSYLAAVAGADAVVGELWDLLQAEPFYAERTALLVTNDHGRHDEAHGGFSGHGDGCAGCRTIQLLAVGAGLRQGVVSEVPRRIPDIAPTIGALLGFGTPRAEGEVMGEILRPEGAVRGVVGLVDPSYPGTSRSDPHRRSPVGADSRHPPPRP